MEARGNNKGIRLVNLLHVSRTFRMLDRTSAGIESGAECVVRIVE